jgi:hypothetical protein
VTIDTISKFNRDTVWLATGVLGTVVFAALVLVIARVPTEGDGSGKRPFAGKAFGALCSRADPRIILWHFLRRSGDAPGQSWH